MVVLLLSSLTLEIFDGCPAFSPSIISPKLFAPLSHFTPILTLYMVGTINIGTLISGPSDDMEL